MLLRKIARHLVAIAATVLLGGLLSATMVRFTSGFGTDEQQLDPRLSADSLRALRESHSAERNAWGFYAHYLKCALHGDLGTSHSLNQPVRSLLAERLPVTVRLVAFGLALGWILALGLAFTSALMRRAAYSVLTLAIGGVFLCLPAAVLALLSVVLNAPGYLAIALIVFPKVFTYCRNLLRHSYSLPHIVAARAKGLGELRILLWHVLPISGPSILALAGISVSIGLGAAIPVEALCGLPGIGDLAWQAALGRDLPLLVNITVLVTFVTLLANSSADVMGHMLRH